MNKKAFLFYQICNITKIAVLFETILLTLCICVWELGIIYRILVRKYLIFPPPPNKND